MRIARIEMRIPQIFRGIVEMQLPLIQSTRKLRDLERIRRIRAICIKKILFRQAKGDDHGHQARRTPTADPADAGGNAGDPQGGEDHHRGPGRQTGVLRSRPLPAFRQQGADVRRPHRVRRAELVRRHQPDHRRGRTGSQANRTHPRPAPALRPEEPRHDPGTHR